MSRLKYKVIKSKRQYSQYCNILEVLMSQPRKSPEVTDEIELLTVLIEKWDKDHNSWPEADPIELLRSLMTERNLRSKDLVEILNVSKGLVSDILNYKKGLSKEVIKTLAEHFKVSQEAFNRPIKLQA
jgi:HTH-type transcriptional regulator/antitoxin HigA